MPLAEGLRMEFPLWDNVEPPPLRSAGGTIQGRQANSEGDSHGLVTALVRGRR